VSDFDAYDDDMRWILASNDREIERLLAGKTPADDERLDELTAFLAELKDAYLEPLDEGVEIRHLRR
jgi:dsDNA-binding SOS-regulon protein